MGIEHRQVEEEGETRRCPSCKHISTVKVGDNDEPYVSLFAGCHGPYFVCQNPACNVERIYSGNLVMVSGALD
jgi:hypothetical protein